MQGVLLLHYSFDLALHLAKERVSLEWPNKALPFGWQWRDGKVDKHPTATNHDKLVRLASWLRGA